HFAEVEQAFIKFGPFGHATFVYVVGQVINNFQPCTLVVDIFLSSSGVDRNKIHIIDTNVANTAATVLTLPAIYQIDERVANAFDGWDIEFHGAAAGIKTPCTQLKRALIGLGGIVDAKRDGTDGRAM